MMRSAMPAAALLVLLLSTGCRSPYWRSRGLDALDAVPASAAYGYGLAVSVHATPLLNGGLGLSPVVSERFGYEDRHLYGAWSEYDAPFPWSLWVTDLTDIPPLAPDAGGLLRNGVPLSYRWQMDRDAPLGEGHDRGSWEPRVRQWGRHPPYGREIGGGLGLPTPRRKLAWRDLQADDSPDRPLDVLSAPERATLWEVVRPGPDLPRPWDLFQVDVYLVFFGVRLGVRPVEFVDLLVGFVGFDPLSDDVPATTDTLPPLDRLEAAAK
jgi:hypothetical protein